MKNFIDRIPWLFFGRFFSCRKLNTLLLFCFLLFSKNLCAQDTLSFWEPAKSYDKDRGKLVGWGLSAAYVGSMTGLYFLWYDDYALGSFHSFDDNGEWLQMDKAGHFGSAYYLGKWGIDLMQWTGMPHKKATWIGGSLGLAFLTTIEVFDGFSEQWGFSTGDMIANVTGSALAISQELAWKEQRMKIKFSWHDTEYNEYNPDLLGSGFPETLFKDYNGQTYWLSCNIHSFLPESSKFPKWLNIAGGYGAEGMTGATENVVYNGEEVPEETTRFRQYYISPDIDLTKIPMRNKVLKSTLGLFGFIKIPAPTLEINENGKSKFYWLYF
jgi:uncharacterized protein YfiM (DUF2279 family)